MTCLAANNAYGTLLVGVDSADLTITLSEGEGSRFPSPVGDEFFTVTVFTQAGDMEIMYCTARDGDVLTVQRAQEGTTALTFLVGARVENRFTAGMYSWLVSHVLNAVASKQDVLTFDNTPTTKSTNPVTSGGIADAIADAIAEVNGRIPTGLVTVVQTYSNGTNWYRKWSDGWIEQGGYDPTYSYGADMTVTLNTAYADTNYTIVIGSAGGSESTCRVQTGGKTTTTFHYVRHYSGSNKGSGTLYWRTSGWGA